MDLNRLSTFIILVESGSITAAARRLFRTPQAISLQIKQLEGELKFNLVQFVGKHMVLTDAGQTLYQELKPTLFQMRQTVEGIRTRKEHAAGVIRIGAWLAQSIAYIPSLIEGFSAQYPDVKFSLRLGTDHEQARWLEVNEIDLAFVTRPAESRMFLSRPVYSQPLVPVAARALLKRYARPRSVRDTLALPLVDYPAEISAYVSWVRLNCPDALGDARRKQPVAVVENSLVARELMVRGVGFGFLHQELLGAAMMARKLERLEVEDGSEATLARVRLMVRRKNSLGFVQREFVNHALSVRGDWTSA